MSDWNRFVVLTSVDIGLIIVCSLDIVADYGHHEMVVRQAAVAIGTDQAPIYKIIFTAHRFSRGIGKMVKMENETNAMKLVTHHYEVVMCFCGNITRTSLCRHMNMYGISEETKKIIIFISFYCEYGHFRDWFGFMNVTID